MMTPQPGNRDLELLSAYLDGALTSSERTQLEVRLQQEPDLRAALDDLRQTVQLIQAVPKLAPPRNFTLDPAKYRRGTPWWARFGMFQLVGAVGAAASVAIIALGLVLFTNSASPVLQPASGVVAPQGAALVPTVTITQARTNEKTAGELAATMAATVASTSVPATPANISGAADQAGAGGFAFAATATIEPALPKQFPTETLLPTATLKSMVSPSPMAAMSGNSQLGPQAPSIQSGAAAPPGNAPTVRRDATSLAMPTVVPAQPTSIAVLPTVVQVQASPTPNATPQVQQGQETNVSQSEPSLVPPPVTDQLTTPFAGAESNLTESAQIPSPSSAPTNVAAFAANPTDAQTANTLAAKDGRTQQPKTGGVVLLIAGIALLVFSTMVFGLGWLRSRMESR